MKKVGKYLVKLKMRQAPGQRSAMWRRRSTEAKNKWPVLCGGGWLLVKRVDTVFTHIFTHALSVIRSCEQDTRGRKWSAFACFAL